MLLSSKNSFSRFLIVLHSLWIKSKLLLSIFRYLLSKGADVNLRNNIGNSALILAAEHGHIDIVDVLVDAGADVKMQNDYGQSALMLATENGHLQVVELLATLTQDSNQLHVRNKYDKTALLVASQLGKLDIVNWILSSGNADVNVITTHRGMSSLMYACSYSTDAHEKIVDLLLANGADVNAVSSEHDTPLFWAAVGGRSSVILKLIQHGAKVNQINKRGFSALMKAAERNQCPILELLCQHKASVDLQNQVCIETISADDYYGHNLNLYITQHFDYFLLVVIPMFSLFSV